MPSKTFENLPQEKKSRIIKAIMKEIVRSGYSNASINQIVKNAGIPRGSFYQYFDDKYDMFKMILTEVQKKFVDFMSNQLKETKSIFAAFIVSIRELEIVLFSDEEEMIFHRKLFADKQTLEMFCGLSERKSFTNAIVENLIKDVDINKASKKQVEDFYIVLDMIMEISGRTIFDIFSHDFSHEERVVILNEYERKLNIIKSGVGYDNW